METLKRLLWTLRIWTIRLKWYKNEKYFNVELVIKNEPYI